MACITIIDSLNHHLGPNLFWVTFSIPIVAEPQIKVPEEMIDLAKL